MKRLTKALGGAKEPRKNRALFERFSIRQPERDNSSDSKSYANKANVSRRVDAKAFLKCRNDIVLTYGSFSKALQPATPPPTSAGLELRIAGVTCFTHRLVYFARPEKTPRSRVWRAFHDQIGSPSAINVHKESDTPVHVPTREELSHQLLARPVTKPQLSRAEPATRSTPSHFYRGTLERESGSARTQTEREGENRRLSALLRP